MIWTEEDIEYLKEHIGTYKITTIAENLNRTYDSVVAKLHRLGISSNTKIHTGLLTLGELAHLLNVERNTELGEGAKLYFPPDYFPNIMLFYNKETGK